MTADMMKNVDFLRERTNVTYEEAITVLERNEGDVMRALVELEHEGRVNVQHTTTAGEQDQSEGENRQAHCDVNQAKEKASSFFNKACQTRLVIEKESENGEKSTVANLSAPFAVGVTVLAPYITLASAALSVASGYQVRVKKDEKGGFI